MPYHGHIEHGAVVLDESVKLPDGTKVRVEVIDDTAGIHPEVRAISGVLSQIPDAREEYASAMRRKHR